MINFSERNEEIFHLRYNEGISPKELSLRYGIHVSTIYNICKKIKLMKNSRKNDLFALCEKYCKYPSYAKKIFNALKLNGYSSVEEFKLCDFSKLNSLKNIGKAYYPIVKEMYLDITYPKDPPILKMTLCEARHITPEKDGAIFPFSIKNVTDVNGLEKIARDRIWEVCYTKYKYGKSGYLIRKEKEVSTELLFDPRLHIDLYVMGLTVALISVVNVCLKEDIDITLWHHDKNTGDYYPQEIYQC